MAAPRIHGLKILHCAPHLSRGGAERQLCYLAAEQAARGHQVHVAYLEDEGAPAFLASSAVTLHRIAARGNYDPRLLLAVHRLIRSLAPDVVQSWLVQMEVVVGMCVRATAAPWVLREPASGEHYRGWKAALRAMLARRAAAIVANSPGGAGYWRTHCPSAGVRVIRNGLPLPEIQAAPPRAWRAGGEAPVPFILFAGRLEPQKNLEALLRAFALLPASTRVHAIVCGEGSLRGRLEVLATELGLAGRVAFLGQQPAEVVWGLMKSACALTFVSRYEGLPNVVLEAVACRCPLLLSDIPAHRELGCEAEFVKVDDERDIARGIAQVLSDPDGSARKAERAASGVQAWSISGMADAYDQLYRDVRAAILAQSSG
jgi:glycosyltransferase involved in cell wall biosynthesis